MIFKKILCTILTVCLCVATMGMSVSAEVIDSTSKRSPGGTRGTMNSKLTAEKTYQPPSSSGESYYYATRAYYSRQIYKAQSWTLTGVFKLRTSQETANSVKSDVFGTFISKTRLTTQEQYVSGEFTSTAVSSEYGTVTVQLNVAY